jgi:hypothetical protein
LIIGPEPNTSIQTTQPINYKLTVKDLKALKVSGSGNVNAEDISTDELAVILSGAGNVKIGGETDSQEINISGSGSYQAEDLESKEVKVDVGGSGSTVVNVSDELNAEVSGIGCASTSRQTRRFHESPGALLLLTRYLFPAMSGHQFLFCSHHYPKGALHQNLNTMLSFGSKWGV